MSDIEGLLKDGQEMILDDATGNAEMVSDKNILKNILYNLSSNAIKYSGEGSQIKCIVRPLDDGKVSIAVEDQGMGIPLDDQKHLFSRFFRASNVTNIQGTGLGLNIVAGYVDMLGGSITFDSREEEGTTFTVTIPLNLEHEG
jgi:signal transduction histidine kinase